MSDGRLLDHIASARWFGGKGRRPRLAGLTPLPWLRPPGVWPAVRIEIAELAYPDGDPEHYQLLIGYRPEHDQPDPLMIIEDTEHGRLAGVDATDDPAAHDVLLSVLLSGLDPDNAAPADSPAPTVLVPHLVDHDQLHPGLPARVFGGQQSNTSIMYAHVAMLKLFRRLELGRNPDIDAHERLGRTGTRAVARLFGWLEGSWTDSGGRRLGADLAMLVEQLADARDGWELALGELRTDQDFTGPAADLGRALAAVHASLREVFPRDVADGDRLADQMADRLERAVTVASELGAHRDGLLMIFDRLRGRRLPIQRVHGDFHLGQTLHTPQGWKIIDFEGEPAKSMAERVAPDSVWRDVAGALRSFDYAAAHRRDAFGQAWATDCRTAFLDGYGAGDDHDAAELLPAYVADKAVYEVVYEARNRPDWLPIPLAAVAAIAGAHDQDVS